MALNNVSLVYSYFADPEKSQAISEGDLYVGIPDLDAADIPTNQKQVYHRQEDGSDVPVTQPLQTGAGGVILINGSPAQIVVDGNYSIVVLDKNGAQKYYDPNRYDGVPLTVETGVNSVNLLADLITSTPGTSRIAIGGRTSIYDGGEGEFVWIAGDQSTNVNGDPQQGIWVAPSTDTTGASGAWRRDYDDAIHLLWFGASTSSTPFQAALDVLKIVGALPILLPSGSVVVDTQLEYQTSTWDGKLSIKGSGMKETIIDNRVANGYFLNMESTGANSQFQVGAELTGFSVQTTTNPVSSSGIRLRGNWWTSINDIEIEGLTGNGIVISNANQDPDSSIFPKFSGLRIVSNGGDGIQFETPPSQSATSIMQFDACYIVGNTGRGVALYGILHQFYGCTIALNEGGGIVAPSDAGNTAVAISIRNSEFDKNVGYDIDIQAAIALDVSENRFIYGATPKTGVRLGDGVSGEVRNAEIQRNSHRRDDGTHTCIEITSTATDCSIEEEFRSDLANLTLYSNAGTRTRIRDQGFWDIKERWTTDAPAAYTTPGQTYNPTNSAVFFRVVLNPGATTLTIGPATDPEEGQELEMQILNNSGGGVTVTFDSSYRVGGYTDPANGQYKTARFRYFTTSAKWEQIGSWSPDFT